jgi:hypothetical protein
VKAATQQAEVLKGERDVLARKVKDHEGKVKDATGRADEAKRDADTQGRKLSELTTQAADGKGELARVQRERDEQKQVAGALLDIVRKELMNRPAVKADPKLREQVEKADAKAIGDLYLRLR